jgi:large subunit ribosomal protein L4
MAEKKTTAKKTTAAKKEEKPVKATAAKATSAKPAAAKAAAKKTAAPPRRAVARPVTRVARPAPAAARAVEPEAPQPKREKPQAKPLPTAPAGHAPLIAADGSVAGSLELPAALTTSAKKVATLFQAFLASRANARQATSATKNRSRVSGGGAKPWRQKGTGRARQGSTRSPHWRHGGVVFGPNGRKYEQRIPEKMRRAAFAEAVAARAAEGRVLVLEDLKLASDEPRTREVVAWLGNLGDTGQTVVVASELDERLGRAMANLPELEYRTPGSLRLLDVLESDTLLVMRPALDALVARAEMGAAKAVHA